MDDESLTVGQCLRILRHTSGTRAMTVGTLARVCQLEPDYLARLEADTVPLLPEAGALVLTACAQTLRERALTTLSMETLAAHYRADLTRPGEPH